MQPPQQWQRVLQTVVSVLKHIGRQQDPSTLSANCQPFAGKRMKPPPARFTSATMAGAANSMSGVTKDAVVK